jgi:hypothetical protein
MIDFAGVTVLFFAFLPFAFAIVKVVLTYFGPVNADLNTIASLNLLWVWIATWGPPALSQTGTNIQNHFRTYYPVYLLLLVLLGISYGTYSEQPSYDKTNDAWETAVVLPFMNKVVLPTTNFLRITFDAIICLTNIVGNLSRIVRNQFVYIMFNCATMDWDAVPVHAGKFAVASINTSTAFIISGFTENLDIAPVIGHLADGFSELNPLFDCQCNDVNFLWPMILNADYGLIQSKHLHLFPDAVVNLGLEFLRKPFESFIGIAERVTNGCSGDRDCEVEREPKFDRLGDLTCQVFTHQFDFLDDVVFSVDSVLSDKLALNIPWTRPPRVFALLAMPLCAISDVAYGTFDTVSHIDLFFTLSPTSSEGNYASEFPVEKIMSRFNNMTVQLEKIGDDIGGRLATNIACVSGRSLSVVFRIVEFVMISLRRLIAKEFAGDAVKNLMGTPTITTIITALEADVGAAQDCLIELEQEIGPVLTPTIIGTMTLVEAIVRIVREFVQNKDDLLQYFGGTGVQLDVNQIFDGIYIMAGATGKNIRRFGAFGSVQCQTRNVVTDPTDLGRVETLSMHLNLMCALGTLTEMYIRLPFVILQHLVDGVLAITRTIIALTDFSNFDFEANLKVHFVGPTAPFDIGRENGYMEAHCLIADSVSMIIPSLINLSNDTIMCPYGNGAVADRIYNLFRAGVRFIVLTPVWFVRGVMQTWTLFLCDDPSCFTFEVLCEKFVLPRWIAYVVPIAQVYVAIIDTVDCFVPTDGVLQTIAVTIGVAFIDTNYNGGNIIVPCSDIANDVDGGAVANFLCDFVSTITTLIDLIVSVFEDGLWQTIWNSISGPILDLIQRVTEMAECVWSQITDFFDTLGGCVTAIFEVDPAAFDDYCTDWDFGTCDFSFEIPEYNIDSPLPPSGAGSGGIIFRNIPPERTEMVGSCLTSDGFCNIRPIGNGYANGYQRDFNGNDCAATGPVGANWLSLGKSCQETGTPAPPAEIGACCVPAGNCEILSYSACQLSSVNQGQKAVWVINETCTSMNSKCNVVSSPYTNQLGCCISDGNRNFLDPLSPVRSMIRETSAYICYNSAKSSRPFFIPGDKNCTEIQTHALWDYLLNSSDAFLDDLSTSPFVNATDIRRDCCTPEDSMTGLYDTACGRQYSIGGPPLYYGNSIVNLAHSSETSVDPPTRIAGTVYGNADFGSYWRCRSAVDPIKGNSFVAPITIAPCVFGNCNSLYIANLWKAGRTFTGILTGNPVPVLNYGNTVVEFIQAGYHTTPFSDHTLVLPLTLAERAEKLNEDFTVTCRYVYYDFDSANVYVSFGGFVATNISSPLGKGDCTGISNIGNFKCFTSDCQFLRIVKPTPIFDQCVPYQPALGPLDTMSSTERTMGILYFTSGPFSSLRDNTDARCNTFVAPDYSIPMAPDEYVEAPVYVAQDRRRFVSFSLHGADNPDHPCHEIFSIMNETVLSRAEHYLMSDHRARCHRSNAWAYFLESLMLYNSKVTGERIIHPHFLYKSEVWDLVMFNVTRGIRVASSYGGHVLSDYTLPNATNVSTILTWKEFAASNNVTDGLSLHIGGFITLLTKMVVAHDKQGRPIPRGLGIIGTMLSAAKWVAVKSRNGTLNHDDSYMGPNPPLFSEYGWNTLTDIFTFNWMNSTEQPVNYTESAVRIQRLRALQNFTSQVAINGLISHGMATSEQALRGRGQICDPRDRSCVDCELVVGSVETLVEIILNCVEDVQDTDRFNIDINAVDLTRSNTFLQKNDTLKCRTPDPITSDNLLLTTLFDITDWIAQKEEGFARYWLARIVCYATNFDDQDPHSVLFYFNKVTTCDPITDGSAHRGRAGAGLGPAFIWVTVGVLILFLVGSLCLPIIPLGWITVGIWLASVLMVAYWWSPSCFIPLPPIPVPVLPDALADDLYSIVRDLVPKKCTQYHPDITTAECNLTGRTFVDCGEYGFDYLGTKHLAYMLYSIDPTFPTAVRDTSIPFLSSLMQTPYYFDSFSNLEDVHGTPIGEYCFGLNDLSLSKTPPLFLSIVQIFIIGSLLVAFLALVFLAVAIAALLYSLYADAIASLVALLTRVNISTRRYVRT